MSRPGSQSNLRLLLSISLAFAAVLLPSPSDAQEIRLTGQVRPRYEQRSPHIPSAPVGDVTMRTRIGVIAELPESITLQLALQDVFVWGGSSLSPGGGAAPEVFVAFAEMDDVWGSSTSLRIGRQEIALGNQRLISNNNWGQRGRRFDGLRFMRGGGDHSAELFALRLSDSGTGTGTGSDAWMHGAFTALSLGSGRSISLYTIYNRERGPFETDQYTAGGHTQLSLVGLEWIGEGYLQRGERRDKVVAAYFFAIGAERSLGRVRARLLYEHYSGNSGAPDRVAAFDRLVGSNHTFHGYADLLTNIPVNTGGAGLRDLSLRTTIALGEGTDLQANGHLFLASERESLSSQRFGEEIDVVLTHRPRSGVVLEAGLSRVIAGGAFAEVMDLTSDLTFGYAMLTASF